MNEPADIPEEKQPKQSGASRRYFRARRILQLLRKRRGRLLIAFFIVVLLFAGVAMTQHWFVHTQLYETTKQELGAWAAEVTKEIAFKDKWVYLSEYGRTAFATLVRFTADVLNGIPSIVIGIFAYGLAVLPVHRFSALAGGLALGFMMLPIVARTTEELLNLVPASLREGSLALGATRAQAAFGVMVPAALPGIMTGILLAIARIAGETAPLLFTSFNNRFFTTRLDQPIASLTVQVFTYAISPYEDWHRQAWAGALVLVAVVFVFSVLARVATRRLERMHRT